MFKQTDALGQGPVSSPSRGSASTPEKTLTKDLIDQVNVTIEAYIGQADMTVAELRALKTGETIELDAALNTLVALKLNDAVVAIGELVAVGDNFGVRIVELG
ncbi:MAG: FliM/FliN family flagellar motor switch protein [Pseudomonadota bacterium]